MFVRDPVSRDDPAVRVRPVPMGHLRRRPSQSSGGDPSAAPVALMGPPRDARVDSARAGTQLRTPSDRRDLAGLLDAGRPPRPPVVSPRRPTGPRSSGSRWSSRSASPPAAVVWPPVTRGDGSNTAVVCLGVGALLCLIPSIGGLIGQLVSQGAQTLVPSAEAAYPWLLALLATSLFAGIGLARRIQGGNALRRRRLIQSVAFALGLTFLAGQPVRLGRRGQRTGPARLGRASLAVRSDQRHRRPTGLRRAARGGPKRPPDEPSVRHRGPAADRLRGAVGDARRGGLPLDRLRRDRRGARPGRRRAHRPGGLGPGARRPVARRRRRPRSTTTPSTCRSSRRR